MKNQIIILAFTFIVSSLIAQQKGINQLPTANRQLPTSTYAVVVGISDYQDPGIPDLRFADKDAEAFANYLRSSAGGRLDNDHLKVLINEKATVAQFAIQLDWLMESAKENDKVIIYFSGHGDVEKKTVSQPGYLLCWDAPARVYLAGGALALPMFQDIITTLSTQNKSKVIVITDACRSGKLAGSSIGGSQITGANLAKQYSNEIKILSCQPNEYSIEGEQWGGGRGVFSYHLIDALYGLADKNNDLWVTLQEVGRYLEDHVSNEVAPVNQLPMMLGNGNERLTSVDEKLLASIKSGKLNQTAVLTSIDSRGMEEEVLSQLDSSTRKFYSLFKIALKEKIFLEPLDACAEYYYQKLIAESRMHRLHSTLTRNYAAALQDGAQQWLNSFLKDPKFHGKHNLELVKPYPSWIKRAAELLGEKHYMYSVLKARQYFFEGKIAAPLSLGPNKILGQKALEALKTSLLWIPNQPHVFMRCGHVFQYMFVNLDSAEIYFKQAAELAPNWVFPYTQLAALCFTENQKMEQALLYLKQAEKVDSNSVDVSYWFARFYTIKKDLQKVEYFYKKCIRLDVENPEFHTALGTIFLDDNQLLKAKEELQSAILMDSTDSEPFLQLGITLDRMEEKKGAEQALIRSIQLDSTDARSFFYLALVYSQQERNLEAELLYQQAVQVNPSFFNAFYNIACLKAKSGQAQLAFDYLEKAFYAGFDDFEFAQNDPDLTLARSQTDYWKALMKKYFPDKIKN
jgi:tetratricopeptide (TPR) repeat protein